MKRGRPDQNFCDRPSLRSPITDAPHHRAQAGLRESGHALAFAHRPCLLISVQPAQTSGRFINCKYLTVSSHLCLFKLIADSESPFIQLSMLLNLCH
ncbi:MAG: hypothetical protein KME57_20685 [Scytonema hyalinum WJT4-NPBG1]|nr:hypothetical protein [Scytonema hyalinum WJT4-NPBG1]